MKKAFIFSSSPTFRDIRDSSTIFDFLYRDELTGLALDDLTWETLPYPFPTSLVCRERWWIASRIGQISFYV